MNRRNFLRAAVALAVSPAIPAPAAAPSGAGGVIGATFVSRAAVLNESWVCFIHPDNAVDLSMLRWAGGEIGRISGFRFIESP